MRLTRDTAGDSPATDSSDYQACGREIDAVLRLTYLYPATRAGNSYNIEWPWCQEGRFRRRLLSSYSGTAIAPSHRASAVGMLREVEFISPSTLDTGQPVYLLGYIFERDGCRLRWREACKRLQLGGERGYGWGDLELAHLAETEDARLFNGSAVFLGGRASPLVRPAGHSVTPMRLLAHAPVAGLPASGEVEPLVGREWRSNEARRRFVGQYVDYVGMFYTPGSSISQALDFSIGRFGLWNVECPNGSEGL